MVSQDVMSDIRATMATSDALESFGPGAVDQAKLGSLAEGTVVAGVGRLEAIVQLTGRPTLLIQND